MEGLAGCRWPSDRKIMTRCVRGHYRRAAQQVTISFMNPSLSPFRSPDVRAFTFSERILGLFSSSYAFFVSLRFLSPSLSLSLSLPLSLSPSLSLSLLSSVPMRGRWTSWRCLLDDRRFAKRKNNRRIVDNLNYVACDRLVTPTLNLCSDLSTNFILQSEKIKRIE